MRPTREVFQRSSTFPRSAVNSPRHWALFVVALATACGQASPQGLDELGARPGVGVVELYPRNPEIDVRESVQFVLREESGERVEGRVDWSATGGTISRSGLYTAGARAGSYLVTAKSRGRVATQSLTIIADSTPESPPPTDSDDTNSTDPPEVPTTGSIIFQDDFENGDFTVWSTSAPAGDSQWDGMGQGGAHIGDGFVTNEKALSGRLAWKALVDPTILSYGPTSKSSLERWKGMGSLDFNISAWYFIPTDYPAVWSNVMQIKAAGTGPSRRPVAVAISRSREVLIYSGILRTTVFRSGVNVPLGQWFNLTGRFVIADSGLVEVFLNGKKIAAVRTDTKDNDYAYPGVGNYIDADGAVRCHIYIDDVKVTS